MQGLHAKKSKNLWTTKNKRVLKLETDIPLLLCEDLKQKKNFRSPAKANKAITFPQVIEL